MNKERALQVLNGLDFYDFGKIDVITYEKGDLWDVIMEAKEALENVEALEDQIDAAERETEYEKEKFDELCLERDKLEDDLVDLQEDFEEVCDELATLKAMKEVD